MPSRRVRSGGTLMGVVVVVTGGGISRSDGSSELVE